MNNLVQNEAINKKNLETGVPFLTRVCLPARGSTAKIGLPRDWHFCFDRLTGSWQSGTDHFTDQSFHWNRNSKHNKTSTVEWSSFPPSLPQSLLLFTIYNYLCWIFLFFCLPCNAQRKNRWPFTVLPHWGYQMPMGDWKCLKLTEPSAWHSMFDYYYYYYYYYYLFYYYYCFVFSALVQNWCNVLTVQAIKYS